MSERRGLGRLFAAVYAWLLAVFLGAVLLDIVYSSVLDKVEGFVAAPAVYNEVSDFLLLPGFLTLLAGLAAIVTCWAVRRARNLFIISLAVLVGFEFVPPVLLFPALRTSAQSPIPGVGQWIRLLPTGLASLLAVAGDHELYRR